jgi:hypothetical protein
MRPEAKSLSHDLAGFIDNGSNAPRTVNNPSLKE